MSALGSALLIGLACAALSVVFLWLSSKARVAHRRVLGLIPSVHSSLVFLLLVTLVTSVISFPRLFGDYMAISEINVLRDLFRSSLKDKDSIAEDWTRWHILASISIMFFFRFTITTVSPLLPLPLGYFEPCYVIGALFGRLVGELLKMAGSPVSPAICAMMGASSFAASTTHTFSSIVICLELTGNMDALLPLLVCTSTCLLVSRASGLSSLTQQAMDSNGVPTLAPNLRYTTPLNTAAEALEPVNPLPRVASIEQIENARKGGNPLIPVVFSFEEPFLLGEVATATLPQTLQCDATEETLSALREKKIPLKYQPAVGVVADTMPLADVHALFAILTLEYAFVLRSGKLVGVISRSSLSSALRNYRRIS